MIIPWVRDLLEIIDYQTKEDVVSLFEQDRIGINTVLYSDLGLPPNVVANQVALINIHVIKKYRNQAKPLRYPAYSDLYGVKTLGDLLELVEYYIK